MSVEVADDSRSQRLAQTDVNKVPPAQESSQRSNNINKHAEGRQGLTE